MRRKKNKYGFAKRIPSPVSSPPALRFFCSDCKNATHYRRYRNRLDVWPHTTHIIQTIIFTTFIPSNTRIFRNTIATIASAGPLKQTIERASFIQLKPLTGKLIMDAARDMDIDPEILSPEAAKKQVSQITPSGRIFMPSDATAENFNIVTLIDFPLLVSTNL